MTRKKDTGEKRVFNSTIKVFFKERRRKKASILNVHVEYAEFGTDGVSFVLPGTIRCALSEHRTVQDGIFSSIDFKSNWT